MNIKKYVLAAVLIWCLCGMCPAGGLKVPESYAKTVEYTFSGGDVVKWSEKKIDGNLCRVSGAIAGPVKAEFNFHRVTGDFSGTGTIDVSVGYSTSNKIDEMIEKKHLHSGFRKLEPGEEGMITSPYKGQRYAWIILRMSGKVAVNSIKYSCRQSMDSLYGHVPGVFEYGGGKLPYRLMYPKNYDRRKSYPLVVSVSGSGGVGNDNYRSMEMITLARYLYTKYYHDKGLECFSLVPQIPASKDIPAPFWPKGYRGAPSKYHPDWPAVNAGGWYANASIQLIKELAVSKEINIDVNRIYMTGFSYGGKACWEFLKAEPVIFAAAASGGGWPVGRAYSDPDGEYLAQLKREVSAYKTVPVFIFAGGDDKMRFGSTAVNKEILAQGGKTRFKIYDGAGHVASAGKGWGDIENIRWIFSKKRD